MEARRHRMSPVTPPTTSWKKRESRTDLSQPRHHHPALRTALLGDYGSDRRAAEPACQRHFEMTQGLPSGRHRSRGLKVSPHGRHWWRWLTDCHVGGVILPFARGCLRVGGTFRWVEDVSSSTAAFWWVVSAWVALFPWLDVSSVSGAVSTVRPKGRKSKGDVSRETTLGARRARRAARVDVSRETLLLRRNGFMTRGDPRRCADREAADSAIQSVKPIASPHGR